MTTYYGLKPIDLAMIAGYFLVVMGIGFWAARRVKSEKDFFLGGRSFGKALLVNLARRCVAEGLGRFEWWVLDWNEPSIEFYKSQGGVMQDEWTKVRVDGEALLKLGAA